MAAIEREQSQRFRVRFAELSGGLLARFTKSESVDVDPYLIARALGEVMRRCEFRSAAGRKLLWNDYRMVLARSDFELLGPFGQTLDRDVREALLATARQFGGELLGPMRVTLVADESNELPRGEAAVRTAFLPAEDFAPSAPGERTIVMDGSDAVFETAVVADVRLDTAYLLRWAHGNAGLPTGSFAIVGRPHPGAPAQFISLVGASPKINKQHARISTGHSTIRVARLPSANPVEVNGRALDPGVEVEVAPPTRISLSNGDLVIEVRRA